MSKNKNVVLSPTVCNSYFYPLKKKLNIWNLIISDLFNNVVSSVEWWED
jgi:hypothetical protein